LLENNPGNITCQKQQRKHDCRFFGEKQQTDRQKNMDFPVAKSAPAWYLIGDKILSDTGEYTKWKKTSPDLPG
jgi:hypothetical protein